MNSIASLLVELGPVGITIIVIIGILFLLTVCFNLIIRNKYIVMEKDILNAQNRENGVFKHGILNKIILDYKSAALGSYTDVNTQAIIEKSFNHNLKRVGIGERFIKNANSLLITLGLLGTFVGLTFAVGNIAEIFKEMDLSEIIDNAGQNFFGGLITSLGGMAVAFVTSLIGIGSSILLTIVMTIINAEEARESLMINIEEYLDNSVSVIVSKDKKTEYTMLNNILRETFLEFGEKIQQSLQLTVENFGEKLKTVVMDVNVSSTVLDKTVDRFDSSMANFANNLRDLSDFNLNLRNNIERMDVDFTKVTESLTNSANIVAKNYDSIESFSSNIKDAAVEMTSYNRTVISDIGTLINEVQGTVNTVKKFAEAMDSEMQQHTTDLQMYRENFTDLIGKLGNEVGTLGQHAALSFADALEQNSQELTGKVKDNIGQIMDEWFVLLNSFKENEKLFAKTIAQLPDQTITYSEAAVAHIDQKLDDIKNTIKRI